jgi:ribonuclease BN (tRNA processing enzyme)
MRLSVLGGAGAWPPAGGACSGYLVEHAGVRLLLDPGYATLPRLLSLLDPGDVDAVLVSHGHPDHCADLNPLLRARALADPPPPPLPVYAPPGALDPVLALDRPGFLEPAYRLHTFPIGARFEVAGVSVSTVGLPHFVPNAGLRLAAGGRVLAYTGDTGPDPAVVDLARDADVLVADASFAEPRDGDDGRYLSDAGTAARQAARAGVGTLVLAHMLPGTDPERARAAAAAAHSGPIHLAGPGLVVDAG